MLLFPAISNFVARLGRTAASGKDDARPAQAPGRLDQSRLNGIIAAAMDAIVTVDEKHNIIVFNPAAEHMFGYAASDILGCPLGKLLPQRFRAGHGQQLNDFGQSGAAARRMGSLGSIAACRADGSEFPAEASISQFRVGPHVYYTAIVRDVSERTRIIADLRASEQRERKHAEEMKHILFAVPAAVCIAHDRFLLNITANDLHAKWFGASAQEAAAGTASAASSNENAVQPFAVHPYRDVLQRAADGADVRNYRFSDLNPDGSVRHLLGNAMTIRDDDLAPAGAICAFIDVTELAVSEMKLLSATQVSTEKSDYITQMTHELRTPLGTMLGYAQLLESGKSPLAPDQSSAVRQILKAGWHLHELINEVQQLSTIDGHAGHSKPERVELGRLLEDMRAMIEPLLLKKQISADFSSAPRTDVLGNAQHCRQVMLNLLSNAIKYNRQGGTIHVDCHAGPAGTMRITVRDTGIGLDTAQLAGLFQPFNRLGREAGGEIGSGIGLVVTKRLVESMGGTIGAESSPGAGSAFWVSLPCAPPGMPGIAAIPDMPAPLAQGSLLQQ